MPGFINKFFAAVANSIKNVTINDVIGNRNEKSFSNFSYKNYGIGSTITGHLVYIYYHIHSPAICYPKGVAVDGVEYGANPITLTSDNTTPWKHGAKTEIIATDEISTAFDVHFVNISDISAVDDYELILYSGLAGAEVLIGRISFSRSNNFAQEGDKPIQIPPEVKGTRISASLACGDGDGATCNVKLYTHSYPDLT